MNKLLSSLIIVIAVAASSLRPAIAGSTDAGKDAPQGSRADRRNLTLAQASDDLFGAFTRMNLSLSKSSTAVSGEGLPAELGFTDDIGKSFEYHADFFLKWSPNTNNSQGVLITPDASVEGHLSSNDKRRMAFPRRTRTRHRATRAASTIVQKHAQWWIGFHAFAQLAPREP